MTASEGVERQGSAGPSLGPRFFRLVWLLPVLFFGSLAYALDGYFVGLTEGRILSLAMIAAVAVDFLPWAQLAAARQSVHLLWLAMAVFMAARVVSLGVMVPRSLRKTATGWKETSE